MTSNVAMIEYQHEDPVTSLRQAFDIIGGIDDLNVANRSAVVKIGIFSHKAGLRTSANLANAVTRLFDKAPKLLLGLDGITQAIFLAIGGLDLAILDCTYEHNGPSNGHQRRNALLVGRDAVAVETVGAALLGHNPHEVSVIQEFARKGLGEGNIKNIHVMGNSAVQLAFERIKKKFMDDATNKHEPHSQRM